MLKLKQLQNKSLRKEKTSYGVNFFGWNWLQCLSP